MCLYIYIYVYIYINILGFVMEHSGYVGLASTKVNIFFKMNFTRAQILAQYTGGTQNHDGYLCNSSSSGGDS